MRPASSLVPVIVDPDCARDYGDGSSYCANHCPSDYQTCRQAHDQQQQERGTDEPFEPIPFQAAP